MRRTLALLLAALAAGAGAWLAARALRAGPPAPPAPAVVERIRETARLQTLEVLLYRKISFVPEPVPRDSVWGDLAAWVGRALRSPRGRAIVFARARLGLDLSRIGPGSLALEGGRAWVVLPPLEASVEGLPFWRDREECRYCAYTIACRREHGPSRERLASSDALAGWRALRAGGDA